MVGEVSMRTGGFLMHQVQDLLGRSVRQRGTRTEN
jgi:hypothetical protein